MAGRRAITALVVTTLGTAAFLAVKHLLPDFDHTLSSPTLIAGCMLGAFGSTLWCHDGTRVWRSAPCVVGGHDTLHRSRWRS
jgi:hypothetical protein